MVSNGVTISPEHRGPWINVATWILLVLMCLATLVKVITKWILIRKLQYDDALIVAGTLIAVGHDIAISVQVTAGLGRTIAALGPADVAKYQQCPVPRTWTILSNKCFDQASFWDAFGTMDIILDLACGLLPVYLLRDLQMIWSRKLPVILFLSSRVLLIPLTVVRIVYINNASSSSDHPRDDFPAVMVTSIHANLSILITCVPFIKPVMDSLQTGILASDVHATRSRHPSYALRWLKDSSTQGGNSISQTWARNPAQSSSATATGGVNEEQGDRGLSVSSREGMIIKQTKTVAIQFGDP
ncbi:MAG: hypothetical protein Q9186_000982 [Xanthomendoza sp. 1 TL-2023]